MRGLAVANERQILRLAGLVLAAGVWLLGVLAPPRGGLTPLYLASLTGLLAALALVDGTLPGQRAPTWRRLLWLGAELALAFMVVQIHSSLIRGALMYLLPASRALLLFGERPG